MRRITAIGVGMTLTAFVGLGVLEMVHGQALPGLHPYDDSLPEWGVRASGAVLAALSIFTLFNRATALVLALFWLGASALTLAVAFQAGDVLAWVPVAETIVFSAFAMWRWDDARGWIALRVLLGVMLLLFDAIHLMQRDVIATIIPDWIPARSYWPWLTGA